MKAGALNRVVTIQKKGADRDELGDTAPVTWQDVAMVWASVIHKSGLEVIRSDAHTSIVRASIRIRYRTDIDASMRVLVDSAVYEITAVMPDRAKHQYTDLVCEIGGTDG